MNCVWPSSPLLIARSDASPTRRTLKCLRVATCSHPAARLDSDNRNDARRNANCVRRCLYGKAAFMARSSSPRSWFSSPAIADQQLRVRDAKRRKRVRSYRPGLEPLEQRLIPAVDLSRFSAFLPDAVDLIQHTGVNEELYNVSLPIISDARHSPPKATRSEFPSAGGPKSANGLRLLNAAHRGAFIDALNASLGVLSSLVQRVAGDPAGNSASTLSGWLNEAMRSRRLTPVAADLGFRSGILLTAPYHERPPLVRRDDTIWRHCYS